MVYISKLTVNESRAIDAIQRAREAQENARKPKLDPVYSDMQEVTDHMAHKMGLK